MIGKEEFDHRKKITSEFERNWNPIRLLMQRIISISLDYLNGIVQNLVSSYSAPIWATLIAGFFVILTLALSMYLIFDHLSVYKHPEVIICSFWYFVKFLYVYCNNMCICFVMAGTKVFDWSHIDGALLCCWISQFLLFLWFFKSYPGLYEARLAESQNLSRNTKSKN